MSESVNESKWWCPRCCQWIDGIQVTHTEHHDERYGGCGFRVFQDKPIDELSDLRIRLATATELLRRATEHGLRVPISLGGGALRAEIGAFLKDKT